MARARGICLLLCLCLALAGCSRTAFVYNRLDFLLPWYIQGYADLNGEQEAYLDELLAPLLAWHRSRELPCYVLLLDDLEAALGEQTLSGEDIAARVTRLEEAWSRLETRGLDRLLALGSQLSDAQIEEFLAELDSRHEALEEEYLPRDDDEFFADSYDAMLDTAEDYMGRLQASQREALMTGSRKLKRVDALWLAERAVFLQRLEALLESRKPGWQQGVRDLIASRAESVSAEYAKALDYNIDILQGLAAEVLNTRSERQDTHLRNRFAQLKNDFSKLAAQAVDVDEAQCLAAMATPDSQISLVTTEGQSWASGNIAGGVTQAAR